MTARIPVLISLALMGCSQQASIDPVCGKPSNVWIPAEDHEEALNVDPVIHSVQITHANQLIVNGWPVNNTQLTAFLRKEKQLSPVPMIQFDFDAHSGCKLVQEVRASIEKSGICRYKNCITGNDDEVPPPPAGAMDGLFDT
jgi:hypothetical protein